MEFALAIDKSGHRVSTVLSQFGTVLFDADGESRSTRPRPQTALDDARPT